MSQVVRLLNLTKVVEEDSDEEAGSEVREDKVDEMYEVGDGDGGDDECEELGVDDEGDDSVNEREELGDTDVDYGILQQSVDEGSHHQKGMSSFSL